jgi:hypothetical protein
MEEDTNPTAEEIAAEPLLQLFKHMHLPPHIKEISQPFGVLARQMVAALPRNQQRSTMLNKLREAKDCACTALIWTP